MCALPSTAANLPCLPGSSAFLLSPNFLRPACPYPGCQLSSYAGSCPMENIPADYRLILCISLTDLFRMFSFQAPFGGRFPFQVSMLPSLPVTAGFSSPHPLQKTQSNRGRIFDTSLIPLVMQPVSAVCGYHPSAFAGHSPHLLSGSHRTP